MFLWKKRTIIFRTYFFFEKEKNLFLFRKFLFFENLYTNFLHFLFFKKNVGYIGRFPLCH